MNRYFSIVGLDSHFDKSASISFKREIHKFRSIMPIRDFFPDREDFLTEIASDVASGSISLAIGAKGRLARGVFPTFIRHNFGDVDLQNASAFRLAGKGPGISGKGRVDADRGLVIGRRELAAVPDPPPIGTCSNFWMYPVIAAPHAATLADAGFEHLRFRDIPLVEHVADDSDAPVVDWADAGLTPYRAFDSDRVLPPATPQTLSLPDDHPLFPGHTYPHPALHYDRAALDALGPFDLALTAETWRAGDAAAGNDTPPFSRSLIASRRLRDALDAIAPDLTWHPVYFLD